MLKNISKELIVRITLISLSAVVAVSLAVNGCNSDSNSIDDLTGDITNPSSVETTDIISEDTPSAAKVSSITFAPVAISSSDAEKTVMRASPSLTVAYDDKTSKSYDLSYKVLAKMGDTIGSGKLGLMTDINDDPILKGGDEDISDGPDGNSLITVGSKHYLVTHMEEAPGEHPPADAPGGAVARRTAPRGVVQL